LSSRNVLTLTREGAREKTNKSLESSKSETGARSAGSFIPAFSYGSLTPFYDSIMQRAMRESIFKRQLVEQARIAKGQRVLDVGCGTGTLTVLLKEDQPAAEVVGVDGDPKILEIARSKIAKAGLNIALDYGLSFELPYQNNTFDRVIFSLVLHHLTRENKIRSLKEAFRVLKPAGELHVADLGRPQNMLMRLPSVIIRQLEEASDNVEGLLPIMIRNSGFEQVEETTTYMTVFGTVALYRARKPYSSLLEKQMRMLEA